MPDSLIIRLVVKVLIPFILLFALYVQFHGDYSPGGGFQAGVIFSSAYLLYALAFGMAKTRKVLPLGVLKVAASLGVLLYAGTGVVSMLLGGEFLNYSLLGSTPVAGQHVGIIVIELGVGITVGSVMLLIFYSFADWSQLRG